MPFEATESLRNVARGQSSGRALLVPFDGMSRRGGADEKKVEAKWA